MMIELEALNWSFQLLFSFCVDAKNDVGSQLSDHSIIAYGIMDGIYIEDRIYLIQRSILPVFDLSVTSEIKPSDVSLQSVAQMSIYSPVEHRYP